MATRCLSCGGEVTPARKLVHNLNKAAGLVLLFWAFIIGVVVGVLAIAGTWVVLEVMQ